MRPRIGPAPLALACALVAGLLVVALGASTAGGSGAGRRALPGASVLCGGSAPIPASALSHGQAEGCVLTGRTVVAGPIEVRVPPPGLTVAADGVGRHGETATLVVSNRAGAVVATTRMVRSGAAAAVGASASASVPADCRSAQYVLEDGGHAWRTTVSWRLRKASVPRRLAVTTVVGRLRAAFAAWLYDRNDCGLGGRPTHLHASYAGSTTVPTGITVHDGDLRCGPFNRTNTVELGSLPGDLLGWTCYWWGSDGAMVAFDTRLESGTEMVTTLPKACRNRWDLQSVATHEFGHAIGLGHVAATAQTMHGVAPACSTAPRTLGRGDRLGLKALYGLS